MRNSTLPMLACEVEALMNKHYLQVSSDVTDVDPLTPNNQSDNQKELKYCTDRYPRE